MKRQEAIVFTLATLSAVGAAIRILRVRDDVLASAPVSFTVSPSVPSVDDDSLSEAAANAAANDPFRLVNRPSTVRYDAKLEGGMGVPAPFVAPVRPPLVLKAVIGGPPWQAIVDGMPGQQPGTIVRTGNTFDKLTVRSVGKDTVVIQAPDTTWKLTLTRTRP
jgi:hypothetical protein